MIDPRDFLTSARRLAGSTEEVDWRSSISRAYYVLFHVARELLTNLGFTVPRADRAHSYLWLRLQNCGETTVEAVGKKLDEIRRERNKADYDLTQPMVQANAVNVTRQVEQLIQTLDALVEPTRSRVRDAMRVYERDVLKDVTWHP